MRKATVLDLNDGHLNVKYSHKEKLISLRSFIGGAVGFIHLDELEGSISLLQEMQSKLALESRFRTARSTNPDD